MNKQKISELLERGVEQVIVKDSLEKKLNSKKHLRIKLGVDPTSPNLHLGHLVVLKKLKQFMDLGHQVIFLIGDFTARIGDPSDKLSARKPLDEDEIKENTKKYKEQVGMVLDLKKVEFRNNSEWHNQMDFSELFRLAALFTVNQMLERDMFQERMKKKKPLWVHELMYPILQGYDSVALRSDLELGGTDQTFNLLAARDIQPTYNQTPQDIMTVGLLEGTDGSDKMSKSVGNTIDFFDTPQDKFGKTMSIPDNLIIKYFSLLTDTTQDELDLYVKEMKDGANPRDFKIKLAKKIVTIFHGQKAATVAEQEFGRMFKDKKTPTDMPTKKIKPGEYTMLDVVNSSELSKSASEARRLIEQGGVSLDGQQFKDWKEKVKVKHESVLKVGKRKFIKFIK